MTRKTFIHRLILAPLAAGVAAVVGKKLPPIPKQMVTGAYKFEPPARYVIWGGNRHGKTAAMERLKRDMEAGWIQWPGA